MPRTARRRTPRRKGPPAARLDVRRVRQGRGFAYLTEAGRPLRAPDVRQRIAALAIPPAWTSVQISSNPHQPIQAVGYDARGRKQYLYAKSFRAGQDRRKFQDLVTFARALGTIRRTVRRQLRGRQPTREAVLAAVVWLLDNVQIRVGGDEYRAANGSFGLTTLLNRHASVAGERIELNFKGKSQVQHRLEARHARVAKIVAACRRLKSRDLLAYVDESGQIRDVTARLVNDYLRSITGHDISAKAFRTWWANVLALEELASRPTPTTETEAKRAIKEVVCQVSTRLHNTPAVCRKSYIHPGLFEAFRAGSLKGRRPGWKAPEMSRAEAALAAWLEENGGSRRRCNHKPAVLREWFRPRPLVARILRARRIAVLERL